MDPTGPGACQPHRLSPRILATRALRTEAGARPARGRTRRPGAQGVQTDSRTPALRRNNILAGMGLVDQRIRYAAKQKLAIAKGRGVLAVTPAAARGPSRALPLQPRSVERQELPMP